MGVAPFWPPSPFRGGAGGGVAPFWLPSPFRGGAGGGVAPFRLPSPCRGGAGGGVAPFRLPSPFRGGAGGGVLLTLSIGDLQAGLGRRALGTHLADGQPAVQLREGAGDLGGVAHCLEPKSQLPPGLLLV